MASPRALLERLNLNPREQRLVSLLAVVVLLLVFLGIPIFVESMILSRRSAVSDARAALDAVQGARGQLRDRQAKKEAVASRYQNKAPALAGFLEQTARAQKLEVTDSVDRPEVPIGAGKRYIERSTIIHVKKAGMYAIAKFLESIERSGHPILISRLNIRKRVSDPDSFDMELGISAYDHVTPSPAGGAKKAEEKTQ
ncbi:type II secretion system protein GspM [Pendulispora albinea]|uniref:Type II secretion system protein GspM n=1 Tax=Pendulispora albinea TaxID=2741071 RepID=A0ABZ2LL53_9BACT